MIRRRALLLAVVLAAASTSASSAAGSLQTPEQFLGFTVGTDNKLARWDKIVKYMKLSAANSDRVRFRELGKTSDGNPFIALEISAPGTLKNLDHYKRLERKLYFQGGAPTDAERDEVFRQGARITGGSPTARRQARTPRETGAKILKKKQVFSASAKAASD